MEVSQLETFVVLAETGHMTEAAQVRHLTQPALSAQLAKLESELDVSLFDRTPKGMVLTREGETFLIFARDALDRMDAGRDAVRAVRGLQIGSLAIGGGATATTYLLPPLLAKFHEDYPGVRIQIREQPSRVVIEGVLSGDLDLGIVTLPLDVPSRDAKQLHVQEWRNDELQLIVPPDHALSKRKSFRWKELQNAQLVLFEAGSAVRGHLDGRIAESGITVDIVMELRSIESIKQMVGQGIGAGFVSKFALQNEHGLRCLDGAIQRTLAVVYRTDRALNPAADVFLKLM